MLRLFSTIIVASILAIATGALVLSLHGALYVSLNSTVYREVQLNMGIFSVMTNQWTATTTWTPTTKSMRDGIARRSPLSSWHWGKSARRSYGFEDSVFPVSVTSKNLSFFSIPLYLPACVSGILLTGMLMLRWRANRKILRISMGMCPVCNYDLTGNVSGICPECGTVIPEEARD